MKHLLFHALSLVFFLSPLPAAILHVDQNADAGGDGSSWDEAFIYVQSALATAVDGDEIWVARGSYYPDQTPGSDTDSAGANFALISGVEIYGGFIGTETLRGQRAPNHYRSVLNGAVGSSTKSNVIVNASAADSTAILDGFTIAYGAKGLYCGSGGAAQIVGCRFLSNNGGPNAVGGGVENHGTLTLRGCSFIGNTAGYGAGVASMDNSITIENSSFHGNHVRYRGGGLYVESSSAIVTSCSFHGNSSNTDSNDGLAPGGGGISVRDGSATFTHTLAWGNFDAIGSSTQSILLIQGGTASYAHSLLEHLDLTGAGTGNFDGTDPLNDPLFENPISVGVSGPASTDGNLSLLPGSPMLEAGVSSTGTLDADGNPRVSDGDLDGTATVDIGAHERPQRVFVDDTATGANDGSSWADAYTKLQDALAVTVTPLEIWVAEGTYYPDEGGTSTNNDRSASFVLANEQSLRGGFAGNESQPQARDFGAHPSVLSGDLQQDDDSTGMADNSYHVVSVSSTDTSASFSGFTITAGNADGPAPDNNGAGMIFTGGGSTALAHCNFTGNHAEGSGAALFLDGASPSVSDSTFTDNVAVASGGALRAENGSAPVLNRCTFTTNSAAGSGGALSNDSSDTTIIDSYLNGNQASQSGGAIANSSGTLSLAGCEFKGNRADQDGGALFNLNSSPSLTNCSLQGNSAGLAGGAIANDNSSPSHANTLIWHNQASGTTTGPAASVSNTNGSAPTYDHSLAEHLDLTSAGTGNLDGGDPANDPLFVSPLDPATAPSLGGNLSLLPTSPAIDAGDDSASTATRDLGGRLRVLDGDNDGTSTIDLGAYERPTTVYVDITRFGTGGADDGSTWSDAYIDLQDALVAAGSDTEIWIASGTYRPDNGGGQTDRNREATFNLKRRVALYGGFAGHETSLDQRAQSTPPTVLSGDLRDNDATAGTGDNSFNVVTADTPGGGARLDNLTITAGTGTGSGLVLTNYAAPTIDNCRFAENEGGRAVSIQIFSEGPTGLSNQRDVPSFRDTTFEDNAAGGVSIGASSIALEPIRFINCTFTDNQANSGSALSAQAQVAILDCTFSANSSPGRGGAVFLGSSGSNALAHTIKRSSFVNNTSTSDSGGGLFHNGNSPLQISNCIFRGNVAAVGGGGAFTNSNATIINSIFQGNRAVGADFINGGGGGISVQGSTFINCSFQGNRASTGDGGGIYVGLSNPTFQNCIVWNNEAGGSTTSASASIDGLGTPDYTHCLAQNIDLTSIGTGNLDGTQAASDPLFFLETDPAGAPSSAGNLRLLADSAAIDAGLNSSNNLATDLDEEPRIQAGLIDLGAYEALPAPGIEIFNNEGQPLANGGPAIDLGLLRLEDLTEVINLSVTNAGIPPLAIGSIAFSGPSAGDFSVTTALPASVDSYFLEPLQLTFTFSTTGPVDASISIPNSDSGEDPFEITFTGVVASDVTDSDNDGLSDFAELGFGTDPNLYDTDGDGASDAIEVNLASLGFENGQDDSALVSQIQGEGSGLGLFTESNIRDLALDQPVISRNTSTGKFTIVIGLLESPDLGTTPFVPFSNYTPTFDSITGKLFLEFDPPTGDAYFFRVFGNEPSP